MKLLVGLLPLLLAIGCFAPAERPPASSRTPEGVVFGPDVQTARDVARLAEQLSVRVRGVFGVERPVPWEMWLLEGSESWVASDAAGHLAERTIRFGPFRWTRGYLLLHGERASSTPYLVAHELVHWFTASWKLPHVLVEGIAEWTSLEITDGGEAIRAERRAAVLTRLLDGDVLLVDLAPLELTQEQFQSASDIDAQILYAYGSLVVEHLGVEGLRRLDGASAIELHSAVAEALERALSAAPVCLQPVEEVP